MNLPLSVYDILGYLVSGLLILATGEFAFEGNWLVERDWKPGSIALYVTMAYIIGHISANLSAWLIEQKFGRGLLGASEELLFKDDAGSRFWARVFPGFFKPLPQKTQQRVLDAAKLEGMDTPGRAMYLHAFAVVKQDKGTLDRLNTFLNLYGFCRNISFALLLALIVMAASVPWYVFGLGVYTVDWRKVGIAALCVVGAVGMLYRYLKFYRHYTHEVFITYPELKKPKEEPKDGKNGG